MLNPEIKTSWQSKGRWKLYLSVICVYLAIICCVQFYIIYNLQSEVSRYKPFSDPETVCEFYKEKECCGENGEANATNQLHQIWKRSIVPNGTCPAGCMPKKRRKIGSVGRTEETRLIQHTTPPTPATSFPGYSSWWYSGSYNPGTDNSYNTYPSGNGYTGYPASSYPSGNGYGSYPSDNSYSTGYTYPSGNGYTSYPSGNGLTGYSSWYGSGGAPGMQGPPGPPGDPGWQGEPGWAGSTGWQGSPGEPGSPGGAGWPGSPGEAGLPGSPGDAGWPGGVGEAGWPGAPGMPGEAGRPGRPGSPGGMGPRGSPGMPGGRGSPGSSGAAGYPGTPGNVGVQGPAGNRGYPGVTFQNGYSGNNGLQGPSYPGGSYYAQGYYGSSHRLTGRGDQTPTDEASDHSKPKNETEVTEVLRELRLLDHPKCKDEVDHKALMQDLKDRGKVSFMILVDLADSVYCIVHA